MVRILYGVLFSPSVQQLNHGIECNNRVTSSLLSFDLNNKGMDFLAVEGRAFYIKERPQQAKALPSVACLLTNLISPLTLRQRGKQCTCQTKCITQHVCWRVQNCTSAPSPCPPSNGGSCSRWQQCGSTSEF